MCLVLEASVLFMTVGGMAGCASVLGRDCRCVVVFWKLLEPCSDWLNMC
jgi:hypothetical protein